MDMRRALHHALGTASFAAAFLISSPTKAVEYGFSEYFLGLTIPMSGYMPPPGAYFWDNFLLYNGKQPGLSSSLLVNIAQAGWFFDTEIFGATPGFVATIPFIGNENWIPPKLTNGVVERAAQTDDIASLGDTDYAAVLGWHAGNNNWALVITGFVPTGNYDPYRFVQTGLNRPALDIKGAYTFFNPETGAEISAALGITFNARNNKTGYQSGAELHFEWALNQHFAGGWAAGLGGYFYQQVTDDYGLGDQVGPFRGRAAAIGPLLSYSYIDGQQQLNLSGRWFHEFGVVNRPEGDTIYATLNFPL